jgi:hypothetical protein
LDFRQALALLPALDPEAAVLLASVPGDQWTESWWLIREDCTCIQGNRGGGVALLSTIHLTRPLGRLLAWLRLSPLIDALDRFVARWRGRWSRYIPKGPAPRRFP